MRPPRHSAIARWIGIVARRQHKEQLLELKSAPGALAPGAGSGGYFAIAAWAAAIFAFTASRLKLAPFCIGGNSIAVLASFSTSCWTNTKRQNSYLNQSKYCCAPSLVPLFGQPVRSNGSSRTLVM